MDPFKEQTFEQVNDYLKRLAGVRNESYHQFDKDSGSEDAKQSALALSSLEMEAERLRLQEKRLADEVAELVTQKEMLTDITRADLKKMRKQLEDTRKRTEKNQKAWADLRKQQVKMKNDEKKMIGTTIEMSDKINYPKMLIETFLKVSSGGKCQDTEFCQIFSGGKCNNCT